MGALAEIAGPAEGLKVLEDGLASLAPGLDVVKMQLDTGLDRWARTAGTTREAIALQNLETEAKRWVTRCAARRFGLGSCDVARSPRALGRVRVGDEGLKCNGPRPEASFVGGLGNPRWRQRELTSARLSAIVLPERQDVLEQLLVGEVDLIGNRQPGCFQSSVPRPEAACRRRVVKASERAVLFLAHGGLAQAGSDSAKVIQEIRVRHLLAGDSRQLERLLFHVLTGCSFGPGRRACAARRCRRRYQTAKHRGHCDGPELARFGAGRSNESAFTREREEHRSRRRDAVRGRRKP